MYNLKDINSYKIKNKLLKIQPFLKFALKFADLQYSRFKYIDNIKKNTKYATDKAL